MPKRATASTSNEQLPRKSDLTLRKAVELWLNDNKAQGFSFRTILDRGGFMTRFLWWLENVQQIKEPLLSDVDTHTLRAFLVYVREPNATGRFGNSFVKCRQEAKPTTVHRWFRELRTLFNFCVAEEFLDASPMRNVKAPKLSQDQIIPLSPDQIQALLLAADETQNGERNRAIILTLLDSGLRVSELISLNLSDLDLAQMKVRGKGKKERMIFLGQSARRSLQKYLRRERREAKGYDPLFISAGGNKERGERLTERGVRLMLERLGDAAKVEGVRVSPHTLRHTFAIQFLRGGGNLFELQGLMGHADLTVLRRYVKLAENDLEKAHRNASPADRMNLK